MISKEKFLPTRVSKSNGFILIFLLISVYTIKNTSIISSLMSGTTFNYIFMPLIWLGIAFFLLHLPRIRPVGSLRIKSSLNLWAFIFAMIYIIITIVAGSIDGFGKSPYSHSIMGISTNIVFVGSALIGREFTRNYLVNTFNKKENSVIFISIALLMTITNIAFRKYINLSDLNSIVQFSASTFMPELSQNLFASYLVYIGGVIPSIIYIGIIESFHWLSPILPNLKWITTALIGILSPIFFMMSVQSIYTKSSKKTKKNREESENPISWIIISIISITIVWFAVGVFPVYPSVILTGSMEPLIKPGDVILVEKIMDIEEMKALKIGDVIQFERDNILISHRIIDIYNDEKTGIGFKTKGDNNSGPDTEIVPPEKIKGSIFYTIPKVGWMTILLRSDKEIDLNDIEF